MADSSSLSLSLKGNINGKNLKAIKQALEQYTVLISTIDKKIDFDSLDANVLDDQDIKSLSHHLMNGTIEPKALGYWNKVLCYRIQTLEDVQSYLYILDRGNLMPTSSEEGKDANDLFYTARGILMNVRLFRDPGPGQGRTFDRPIRYLASVLGRFFWRKAEIQACVAWLETRKACSPSLFGDRQIEQMSSVTPNAGTDMTAMAQCRDDLPAGHNLPSLLRERTATMKSSLDHKGSGSAIENMMDSLRKLSASEVSAHSSLVDWSSLAPLKRGANISDLDGLPPIPPAGPRPVMPKLESYPYMDRSNILKMDVPPEAGHFGRHMETDRNEKNPERF